MAHFTRFIAMRAIFVLPIALLLAFLILLDSPLYRALAVAGLVILEVVRDSMSIGEALSPSAGTQRSSKTGKGK